MNINKTTKKLIKIIFILLIVFNIININKYSYAAEEKEDTTSTFTMDGFIKDGDKFLKGAEDEDGEVFNQTEVKALSDSIYNTLFAIGMVAAVAVGIFLGIQIMMASVEEQAKYKELLIPYFIGCIVIFGAFGIWKIAVTIISGTL